MSLITPEYRALQQQVHARGSYGIGVENKKLLEWIGKNVPPGSSLLDYGCGKGTLKKALEETGIWPLDVREYDPCIEGKDGPPERAQYVVCCDVMEHVEDDCIDNVIHHLHSLTMTRLLLFVDCRPAHKTLPDGRNAHISQHPSKWWMGKFKNKFRLEKWDEYGDEGVLAVLEPAVEMAPLKAIGVVGDDQRNEYVKLNLGRTWKRINNRPLGDNGKTLIVCGYGPSIRRTFRDIPAQKAKFNAEVVSVSGCHDFLRKKGIKPDWHVECDPRFHKSAMMGKSRKGVKYLMASCCNPLFIQRLQAEGADIILWHLFNGEASFAIRDMAKSELDQALIPGGGSVMLRAFVLFYFMGYRRFVCHGFDCSFDGENTHAGAHLNKFKQTVKVRVEHTDLWYDTAPVMITYAQHMLKDLQKGRYPGCQFTFCGEGLFQTMLQQSLPQLNAMSGPTRDYFHLTEDDVSPDEVFGKPPEVANG